MAKVALPRPARLRHPAQLLLIPSFEHHLTDCEIWKSKPPSLVLQSEIVFDWPKTGQFNWKLSPNKILRVVKTEFAKREFNYSTTRPDTHPWNGRMSQGLRFGDDYNFHSNATSCLWHCCWLPWGAAGPHWSRKRRLQYAPWLQISWESSTNCASDEATKEYGKVLFQDL